MGANLPFEDFVSANLGIRQPFIWDEGPPTGVGKSDKAAGIRGAHYLDVTTNFLYEKTGENNLIDWQKIAELGEGRSHPGGLEKHVQFHKIDPFNGPKLSGSEHFIYDFDENYVSGASGIFDTFYVKGDLFVSGTTHVNEVIDATVTGTISGHTGVFHNFISTSRNGRDVDDAIDKVSGDLISVSGESTANYLSLTDDLFETGEHLHEHIDKVSGDLVTLSGITRASILSLGKDLNDTGHSERNRYELCRALEAAHHAVLAA